jgi:translation initiation factor 2B subunit (eIF-2B alpha/beta/delta family)
MDSALEDFQNWLQPGVPIPVAVMKALTGSLQRSEEATLRGLEIELRAVADFLKDEGKRAFGERTSISLDAACALFLRHVTRVSLDNPDFEACKKIMYERGESYSQQALSCDERIASLSEGFIRDGAVRGIILYFIH